MNARERFRATMHYQPRDRAPIMDFGFWSETLTVWQEQGLPAGVNTDSFFGMDPQWITAPINVGLSPAFTPKVLEDRGDTRIVRDSDGVTKQEGKFLGSIPRHLDHLLKDRQTWETHFKPRLYGRAPERYPEHWFNLVRQYLDPERDYPLGLNCGSLYGWIRNWMGVENVSLLVHDDLPLFEEMVTTIADCVIDTISMALDDCIHFDYALMWEDMCYRAGPLLSPSIFRKVLVPQYKRITGLLLSYGVDVVVVDCDGDISQLIPHWLDGGVNCMFPLEVGTWGLDPVKLRNEYGKDLLMIGGVSKNVLAGDKAGIEAEVARLTPLVEEGGYIPTPDHRVPPDVPLENYLFYLQLARKVWGKDLPNLRLMGSLTACPPEQAETRWPWRK